MAVGERNEGRNGESRVFIGGGTWVKWAERLRLCWLVEWAPTASKMPWPRTRTQSKKSRPEMDTKTRQTLVPGSKTMLT